MEITIKINGRMVSVEVSDEVAECYDQGRRKAENLSHEKRRHWDDREFDEYMVAAEGLLPYQPTPEDIVCRRETLALLLSILDTCTPVQKDYVEYLLDFLMEDGIEEQKTWIAAHITKIMDLERRNKEMAEKPTNRERLREITEGIEQNIKELFESEKYMRYLSVMSRFHRYSVNNTMLIYMQKPDAILVAGFLSEK